MLPTDGFYQTIFRKIIKAKYFNIISLCSPSFERKFSKTENYLDYQQKKTLQFQQNGQLYIIQLKRSEWFSTIKVLDVPLVSELAHIDLLVLFARLCAQIVPDQLPQLLNFEVIESIFLLFFLQNQQLLFLLQFLLLVFNINGSYLLLPKFLVLPSFLLKNAYFFLKTCDHLGSYGLNGLFGFQPIFSCPQPLFQLSQFLLLGNVLLMVFSENLLSLSHLFIHSFGLLFDFGKLLFQIINFFLVLLLCSQVFDVSSLLVLDPHQTFFFLIKLPQLLFQIPQFFLFIAEIAVVIKFLKLSLDGVDFVFHLKDLKLLLLKLSLFLPQGLFVIIVIDGSQLSLPISVLFKNLLKLSGQLKNLLLQFDVLVDNFLFFSRILDLRIIIISKVRPLLLVSTNILPSDSRMTVGFGYFIDCMVIFIV